LSKENLYIVPVRTQAKRITGFNYFLVVSATGAVVESGAVTGAVVESGAGVTVSVAGVSSAFFSPSLQAAKDTDTIANAKITFFIFLICLIFKNYNLIFIPELEKGNPTF